MAIHRTEHKQNYTIISNRVINDDSLSWEARMVLIYMLSKPDDWTFSLAGITAASPRSKDSNGRILKELEQHGYLRRVRDYGHGKLGGMIYEIYEEPFQPMEKSETTAPEKQALRNAVQSESRTKAEKITALENAAQQKPAKANHDTASGSFQPPRETATPEIPVQQFAKQPFPMGQSQPLLSTELTNTEMTKTEQEKNQSINPFEKIESFQEVMDEVKEAICYDALLTEWDEARVDSLVVLIVNTLLSTRETIRIGGAEVPAELVKARLRSLNKKSVDYVFECMDGNDTEIRNIYAYLLTALFNAPGTMEEYYRSKGNHDFANPRRTG